MGGFCRRRVREQRVDPSYSPDSAFEGREKVEDAHVHHGVYSFENGGVYIYIYIIKWVFFRRRSLIQLSFWNGSVGSCAGRIWSFSV
jgi:hypothetical protein